jgi:hypothetical protein
MKVYCLNASTGGYMWDYTTAGEVLSSPAVADGKVYVGSNDNKLYCLNASTGALIWSYTTGNYVWSSPAVAEGNVYVGSYDGKVYAFGPVRDVAVTNITPSKTVIGQGYNMSVNVTVENQGDFTETFNVTVYVRAPDTNGTSIASRAINLESRISTTFTFAWNTEGFTKTDYIISAYAWPVPGETDEADNVLTGGSVYIGVPGDVDGSRIVNMLDLYNIAIAFGATVGQPNYVPNYDIEDNGIINMLDLYIAAIHFGQTDP